MYVETKTLRKAFWLICAASILLSAVLVNAFFISITYPGRELENGDRYSYLEFDFPATLMSSSQHPFDTKLVIEDTVHYDIADGHEWESQYPASGGFVRLGPNNRLFGVSMYHQLHCLDEIRRAVTTTSRTNLEKWHVQHCLEHLRQMLLCASSMRLEPVKTIEGELGTDGLGLEHECRDWTRLHRLIDENFSRWPEDL
ncbi:hypothetical protein OBBRIDRAFT_805131 [Obba rivulosa]|uniref:Uncharacterized protein n=1 Tax=Obba rivulosa TaxID=1052685 RepID=A0A8E2APZ9_9APHY|nr:hypothetical protein OBBRIDRAFT_805131 [Obba rivulosa]